MGEEYVHEEAGLSGSFGVVLTVPATVLMAAYIYKGENG
mgnify:CR=1 FL=1